MLYRTPLRKKKRGVTVGIRAKLSIPTNWYNYPAGVSREVTKKGRGRPRRGAVPGLRDSLGIPQRPPGCPQVPLPAFYGPPPYQAVPPPTQPRPAPGPAVNQTGLPGVQQEDFNRLCRVVESLATVIRDRELRAETTSVPQPGIHQGVVDTSNIEKYRRLNPPAFNGSTDPLVAEDWVKETEKLFEAITVTTEQKVQLATFMFRGSAERWWKLKRRTLAPPVT